MAITKQQAQQELSRRRSTAPVQSVPKSSSINKDSARKELARRELVKRGQMQQKPKGFKGLAGNFATDFTSFGKGMLGVGKELITHPIYNSKKLAGVGYEASKLAPSAIKGAVKDVANFGDTTRKGMESFRQLKQIPLAQQKEMLAKDIQRIGESNSGNDNKKKLAQMGLGLLGNYSQYSRFGEKVYAEPFSAALDILPASKALGVSKVISKGSSAVNKIPAVAKTTEAITDAFVPMGKLKRLGYGDVADDLAKTSSNVRKSQEGIIRSTVKKFEKDFKLNKTEKVEFFDAIDAGRRDASYVPTHANPKIQKAIDWYMQKELPKIQKMVGYDGKPIPTKNQTLSSFKYADDEKAINTQLKQTVDDEASLMRSMQKEMGGVDTHIKNETLYGGDTGIVRHSENPGWYRKYYEQNGKAPTKAEILKIAEDELKRGGGMMGEDYKMLKQFADDLEVAKANPANYEKLFEKYKNAPIKNYLHHYFNPSKETSFGGKLSSPSRGFLKQSKDVEGFVKDPIVSIAGVKSKAATANIKEAFVARITKKYGRPLETVTEFKGGKVVDKISGDELIKHKGVFLPKDLAEELTRIEKGEPGWLKTILAPSRAFNRNWKPLATAVRPRYHLRNIIGNMYNASFVGGMNPLRVFPAAAQQMKGHIATQMREGTLAGKVYKAILKEAPEHKMLKMATEDDIIGRGFFSVDINDMAEVADKVEDFSKLIANMDTPAMVYKIPVLKQWMKAMQTFGSAIEDNAKLALYTSQLKKGVSRANAKKYVDKHLFDYMNGLGDADRVIKAIIPFWSWRRFNVPLQFGALAKNPIRHLMVQEGGKQFVQQNEAENSEYKYLSQREKDMGAIKTGETMKDGKVYDKYMRTQGVLPIQDIASVTDPANAGISPMFDMAMQGYNLVNPPENPQENLDYFGRPVESFPGEVKRFLGGAVRGTGKEIMQSIPALSELNKLIGGSYDDASRPEMSDRMGTVFNPTSNTLQDREKNRQYFESDYQRRYGTGTMQPGYLSELKYTAKKVLENPKDSVSVKNLRTLIDLMKQGGMSEGDIKAEISKAIQAAVKKEAKENKPPTIKKPQRISPTDAAYSEEVQRRASTLNPYYTP